MSAHRRALTVVLALVVVALTACTDDPPPVNDSGRENPASPEAQAIFPFLDFRPADTRGVQLPHAASRFPEPEPVAIFGGRGILRGTVDFGGAVVDDLEIPDGAVPGATVQLERFVGGTVGIERVPVDATGRWEARDIKGGRYRIRAWMDDWFGERLELSEAVTLFLTDSEEREVPLTLDIAAPPYIGDVTVYLSADPQPAPLGGDTKLVIRITTTFDAGTPEELILPLVDYEFELVDAPNWEVIGPRVLTTDDEGVVELEARCNATPGSDFELLINETTYTATPPPCEEVDDQPDVIEFVVGEEFDPPFGGPLPSGEYEVVSGTSCAISYQPWVDGDWADRVTVEGDELVLDAPGRDFETTTGGAPCVYRRTA